MSKVVGIPDRNDSRSEFIEQVANTIVEAQKAETKDGSFIFGLSAKWGEGKTDFLRRLKNKLSNSEIIEICPWKYADNKVTLLQSFLLDLISANPKDCTISKNEILQTETTQKVNWSEILKKKRVWLGLIAYLALSLGLVFLPDDFSIAKNCFQVIFTVLFGGLLIPLFTKVATSTVSDHQTSVLINFDDQLNQIIKSYDKKIVIYVDDLDRISAKSAVLVLDNLRTFFDKPELSFIVSGDHTVIERHLGRELLPDEPNSQLEEGRRYLKKIFNVYWRMPIPIDSEISEFIDIKISEKLSFLDLTPEDKQLLSQLLNNLFENNYRNIERMISQIQFTFKIVSAKFNNTKDETLIFYEDLLCNKLLLIKVLLIQELANPYWEYLLKDSDSLVKSDKNSELRDGNEEILRDGIVNQLQKEALLKLIDISPRFYDENGITVKNIEPFIFLAADSSFSDKRGLLPTEFGSRLIETLDTPDELPRLLDRHNLKMLNDGLSEMFDQDAKSDKNAGATPSFDVVNIVALIKQLISLKEDYAKQAALFIKRLTPELVGKFSDSEDYPELLFEYGELVDKYEINIEKISFLISYENSVQISALLKYIESDYIEEVNELFSDCLWLSFERIFMSDTNIIAKFTAVLDEVHEKTCNWEDSTFENDLQTCCISNYTSIIGQDAAKIIASLRLSSVTQFILDQMQTKLTQMQPQATDIVKVLDGGRLRGMLLAVLDDVTNYQTLGQRIRFVISQGLDEADAWKYIADKKLDLIVSSLPQNLSAWLLQSYRGLSPSKESAKLIAQKVIIYAKENTNNTVLTSIVNSNFFFVNLADISGNQSATKYLKKLSKSGDTTNKANADRLLSLGGDK